MDCIKRYYNNKYLNFNLLVVIWISHLVVVFIFISLYYKEESVYKEPKPISLKQPRLFLDHRRRGRFGNQMFQYASAFCIAKRTSHQLSMLTRKNRLLNVFKLNNVTFAGNIQSKLLVKHTKTSFQPSVVAWVSNKSVDCVLKGYLQSYKYFETCEDEVKQIYQLKEMWQQRAINLIQTSFHEHFKNKRLKCEIHDFVHIGVHVRLSDVYKSRSSIKYFDKAFDIYKRKYKNVVFYICSDNISWCEDQMVNRYKNINIIFISKITQHFAEDFSVLVNCNHSIITQGTFGWWAGWLSGGDVIFDPTALLQRHFNQTEFYPKKWIPLYNT